MGTFEHKHPHIENFASSEFLSGGFSARHCYDAIHKNRKFSPQISLTKALRNCDRIFESYRLELCVISAENGGGFIVIGRRD